MAEQEPEGQLAEQGQGSGAASQTQAGAAASSDGQSGQATSRNKPDWVRDEFWDAGTGLKVDELGKSYAELAEFRKAATEREAALPSKAEDYKFEIRKELIPEGIDASKVAIDKESPLYKGIVETFAANRVPADVAQKAFEVFARDQLAMQKALVEAAAAERKKLGDTAPARIDAIAAWAKAHLGEDDAKAILGSLAKADTVRLWERVMKIAAGGNVVPFNQRGQANGPDTLSDEDWNRMTPSARLEYARQKAGGKQ